MTDNDRERERDAGLRRGDRERNRFRPRDGERDIGGVSPRLESRAMAHAVAAPIGTRVEVAARPIKSPVACRARSHVFCGGRR